MKRIILILFIVGILFVSFVESLTEEFHDKDLIIEGNEIYVIEDKDLVVAGNIFVRDNSKLIIRNSKVTMDVKGFFDYRIEILDNGVVEISNSVLDRAKEVNVNLGMNGKSLSIKDSEAQWDISAEKGSIIIENSIINGSNGIFWKSYDPFKDSAPQLSLINSSVKVLMMSFGYGEKEQIKLSEFSPGSLKNVEVKTSEGASLKLVDSGIQEWVVELWDDPGWPDSNNKKHLIIEDSELSGLWLWIHPDAYMGISNFKLPKYFENWNLKDNFKTEKIYYDLTLLNTSVGGESVASLKLLSVGELDLDNVKGVQIAPWGSSKNNIKNSEIEYGIILRGNEDHTVVSDSIVTHRSTIWFLDGKPHMEAPQGGDVHFLTFSNSLVGSGVDWEINCDYGEIKGDVEINSRMDDITWNKGMIKREFSVISENNMPLKLYDEFNKIVWQGISDENGVDKFNITFDKDNYKQKWVIKSREGSEQINFLSSTPIVLEKERVGTREDKVQEKGFFEKIVGFFRDLFK